MLVTDLDIRRDISASQNSLILGIVIGNASFYAIILLKERLKIDDALDVSSVHGVRGIIGTLAIGFIADLSYQPSRSNWIIIWKCYPDRHSGCRS